MQAVVFTFPDVGLPTWTAVLAGEAPRERLCGPIHGFLGGVVAAASAGRQRLPDPFHADIRCEGVCFRVSGCDVGAVNEEDLRRRIAFVFQEYGRYAATVAENIAYGDWPRLADARAEAYEPLGGSVAADRHRSGFCPACADPDS